MIFSSRPIIVGLGLMLVGSELCAQNPLSSDRKWLLGDWNGQRQQFEEQGYKLTAALISEAASNLSGGYKSDKTVENAAQLTLGAQFDLAKIKDWEATTASIVVTKRDGNSLSRSRINDLRVSTLSNIQEIYGRGKIWRLSQAWIKKGFIENTLQAKFGRMGMSEDFNSSQCEFQNLILCGGQLGKSIGTIWYNSPVSVWGMNFKYQMHPEWTVGVGVYEVNPDNIRTQSKRDGFNLDIDNVKGATIPIELMWKPEHLNQQQRISEYKVGALYSTADATSVSSTTKTYDAKYSLWFNAIQQLSQNRTDPKRGLYMSLNLVLNDKATTTIQSTQQLAFWYKGFFDLRPQDQVGLALGYYQINSKVTDRQKTINQARGLTDDQYNNVIYQPVQNNELNVELNYTYHWSPAIMLRPNLQYIHQPSGVKNISDAWVAGLTMRINF